MENNEALFNEKFYKFIPRENGKVTARCQLCPDGDDKAIFHVTEGVSSNLVRHIRKSFFFIGRKGCAKMN